MSNEKKILLLGGNGFIGTALAAGLMKNGWSVTIFADKKRDTDTMKNVKYLYGDFFCDSVFDILSDYDKIVHLISSINPSSSANNPMAGYSRDFVRSVEIINFLSHEGKTMYFASSGGTVYGMQSISPIPETAPTEPINHYGMTKLLIENVLYMYNRTHNTKHVVFRISNPYGPGQNSAFSGVGVIDAFIRKAMVGEAIKIYGDGGITRDFIYIDDMVSALTAVFNKEKCRHGVYNIGSGQGYSLSDLLIQIEDILETSVRVEYYDKRAVDVNKVILDTTRFRDEFGTHKIVTPIKDGSVKTISTLKKY